MKKYFITAAAALFICHALSASAHEQAASGISLVYQQAIPNAPGKSLKVLRVDYAPGGSTPAHVHAKSALIYVTVLTGSIRSQVNDQPLRIYHQGESFVEMPGDRHGMSENASATAPASLQAVFIVDSDDAELTIPLR